jgi:hypothetical protein
MWELFIRFNTNEFISENIGINFCNIISDIEKQLKGESGWLAFTANIP